LQANFPVSQIKINYIRKRSGDMPKFNLSENKNSTILNPLLSDVAWKSQHNNLKFDWRIRFIDIR